MWTNESNDAGANGYGLPESTQRRLKKLQEYVTFLVHLTGPRQANEEPVEIHPAELALCLDQLEQRVAPVMEALSQPFARGKVASATAPDAKTRTHEGGDGAELDTEAEAASALKSPSGERYLSGITLDQVDEINLLLGSLRAIGNVVCCADHAEYSKATLSVMGDAIYRDVDKIHDIVNDIYESQRFRPKYKLNSVREAPASYLALPGHSLTRSESERGVRSRNVGSGLASYRGTCRGTWGQEERGVRSSIVAFARVGSAVWPDPFALNSVVRFTT